LRGVVFMKAREELNKAKMALGLNTDQELADVLKTNKRNIENWVKRNRVPDKWKMIISHHVHPLAKLPLDNEEQLATIAKANPPRLPTDILQIVEILQEFDTKQRRDVLRFVLGMESN